MGDSNIMESNFFQIEGEKHMVHNFIFLELKIFQLVATISKKIPSCKLLKMKFTAGRERDMMHCNNIKNCMTDQSSKGMKKGLHLFVFYLMRRN